MQSSIIERLRSNRIYVLIIGHVLLLAIVYRLAFEMRFDFEIPANFQLVFRRSLPWILLVKMLVFAKFGSFHGWWRHVTFDDLSAVLRVATLSSLVITGIDYILVSTYQIPRSIIIIDWGFTILICGGLRSLWRFGREQVWHKLARDDRQPALLIGDDRQSIELAQRINGNRALKFRIVGLLEWSREHFGTRVAGIPVLGHPDQVVPQANKTDAAVVFLMAGGIDGESVRNLMDRCCLAGLKLRVIPSVKDMLNGATRLQVREINIDDLLRRDAVILNRAKIKSMLESRCVMVTGAGGSIGSEICRQIVACGPKRLLLVEQAENNLYAIQQELLCGGLDIDLVCCVADVTNRLRLDRLFREYKPEIVFHAAAHKHVPLMESNAGEAVANNVFGTKTLADLSDEYGVDRFVLISTDKAVNPTSIMGVTKQLAERYVQARDESSRTKFVVVRFGNVLGSSGSVVPTFQDQIERGGPVTVTHPEMKRFFMTIREASQLVLESASMGRGGEIFILEMGKPVRIVDLAHDLIRLAGLLPDEIEIQYIGTRPGEKLYEELLLDNEETISTSHSQVRVARPNYYLPAEVNRAIDDLSALIYSEDHLVRAHLQTLVQEFVVPLSDRADREEAASEVS